MTPESNPAKLSQVLAREGGLLGAYGNTLAAQLTSGEWGGKFIRVDEAAGGATQARIAVFSGNSGSGATDVRCVDGEHLTRVRCGLMAALAVGRFFGACGDERIRAIRVGLVGSGGTNLAAVRALQAVFGLSGPQFSVVGSPRNPFKNRSRFPDGSVWPGAVGALAECDAVIECATLRDRAEVLELEVFRRPDGGLPALFVSQDGGWVFGPSFRALPSFADHVEQLNAHRGTDYDWPWDEPASHPLLREDLRSEDFRCDRTPVAAAYLSGIGLSDLVVALEADLP